MLALRRERTGRRNLAKRSGRNDSQKDQIAEAAIDPKSEQGEMMEEKQPACSKCNRVIGRYITVGPETWIMIGDIPLYVAHGRCPDCGEVFHFSETEKRLDHLVSRLAKC